MKGFSLCGILFILSLSIFSQNTVNVKDFGAIVNDGIDDAAHINAAIATLFDGDTLMFEEGIYNLEALASSNITHIQVKEIHNLIILGAIDANGKPATHFQRTLALNPTENRWPLLDVRESNNTVVKNFTFDNAPHHSTAGEIVEIDPLGKFLKVKIFDDLPMDDNTPFTAANVWNPNTMDLKEVPSLTFTVSPANMRIDDATSRIMKLELSTGLDFLQHIEVGEYLSWHYGWTSSTMVNFRSNEDLIIENLKIFNSLRSALFISYCKNITVKDVSIKPKGSQLVTSPRDGIHSSRNKGDYLVDNLYVTGTRLDAFVARGTLADVFEITDDTHLKIKTDNSLANTFTYETDFPLEFVDKNGEKFQINVNSVDYLENTTGTNSGSVYVVETSTAIPNFVEVGTVVIPKGFSTKSLILQNNTYENIAGSSEVNFTDNVTSTHSIHRNIMYSAIRMGANSSAGHPGSNYEISNSTFTSCGWSDRFSQKGYIGVANNHLRFGGANINNIVVKNNTFISNSEATNTAAVELTDAYDIEVINNSFCGFREPVKYFSSTTRNINQADNTYCSCSSLKKVKTKPIKDAFLKGGEFGDTNYGSSNEIEIKNSTVDKFNRITYLQFDASKFMNKDVLGASLLLYIDEQEGKSATQSIKIVTDNSWDEATITYNNRPAEGATANTFNIAANYNRWIGVNITTAIKNQLNTNGIITLAITQDTNSSTLLRSYSKESDFYRTPILEFKIALTDKDADGNCDDETLSHHSFHSLDFKKSMLYPNPVKESSNLILYKTQISSLKYEVYNINGALLFEADASKSLEKNNDFFATEIPLKSLSSGIYLLKVYADNQLEIIKFIKQ